MRCLRLRKRHVNRQGFFMTTNQDVFILLYLEETVFFYFVLTLLYNHLLKMSYSLMDNQW